jgi:Tub family
MMEHKHDISRDKSEAEIISEQQKWFFKPIPWSKTPQLIPSNGGTDLVKNNANIANDSQTDTRPVPGSMAMSTAADPDSKSNTQAHTQNAPKASTVPSRRGFVVVELRCWDLTESSPSPSSPSPPSPSPSPPSPSPPSPSLSPPSPSPSPSPSITEPLATAGDTPTPVAGPILTQTLAQTGDIKTDSHSHSHSHSDATCTAGTHESDVVHWNDDSVVQIVCYADRIPSASSSSASSSSSSSLSSSSSTTTTTTTTTTTATTHVPQQAVSSVTTRTIASAIASDAQTVTNTSSIPTIIAAASPIDTLGGHHSIHNTHSHLGSNINANDVVSLQVFRMERRCFITVGAMRKSPFFAEKLDNEWKSVYFMVLRLPRLATVHAFALALEFLVSNRLPIFTVNLFEVLAMAQFLKVDTMVDVCAQHIGHSLSARNIIIASHFAYRCELQWLMQRCWQWIAINLIETGHLIYMMPLPQSESRLKLESASASASTSSSASTTTSVSVSGYPQTLADAGDLTLRKHVYNVPLSAFASIFERRRTESLNFSCSVSDTFVGVVTETRDSVSGASIYSMYYQDSTVPLLQAKYCSDIGEYVISSASESVDDISWHGVGTIGSVRSNLTGTYFAIYDYGLSADTGDNVLTECQRHIRAVVKYRRNILGTVPREFITLLRTRDDSGRQHCFDIDEDEEKGVITLKNKKPIWSEQLGAYTLDFGTSVRLPSKKNFQLVTSLDPLQRTVLMFGKRTELVYHIEFQSPFSILSAFGVVISSFDKKRFVT